MTVYPTMRAKGAKYISAMVEDALRKPPTRDTLDQWITKHKCEYDVVLDPKYSFSPGGTIGMPYNVIVDPRTMKIEKTMSGDGPTVDAIVDALVARNTK
jgi:hypothetical protein